MNRLEKFLNHLSKHEELNNNKSSSSTNTLIWLRHETKFNEGRTALTPKNAQILLKNGYTIYVEKSPTRAFTNAEYAKVGCKLVETNSWKTNAPKNAYILGLKELESKPLKLKHRHIFFAHAFKGQNEAIPLLKRFINGNGEILDLEFLVNENGRRVAAFGVSAGKVGMAMALLTWAKQILNESFNNVKPWKSELAMINDVKTLLIKVLATNRNIKLPRVIIIGALGRCGRGATYIGEQCGITEISKWDLEETKNGGPFKEVINNHEIFVNCINMQSKFPPFITKELCYKKERTMTVISDIACDPNNPNNPVPVYKESTTVQNPVTRVIDGDKPLEVTAIDYLPSLLPKSSSIEYSDALLPTLMQLKDYTKAGVWKRAKDVYLKNIEKIN